MDPATSDMTASFPGDPEFWPGAGAVEDLSGITCRK